MNSRFDANRFVRRSRIDAFLKRCGLSVVSKVSDDKGSAGLAAGAAFAASRLARISTKGFAKREQRDGRAHQSRSHASREGLLS